MEKVAIVNSGYEFGSTGALAKQLFEYAKVIGYEPYAFYGRGKKIPDNHIIKIDSLIEVCIHKLLALLTGYQGVFSNVATSRLINQLKKNNIRKVILLNLHGYYLNEFRLLKYLKNQGIKSAYVTPDEYACLGKCCYSMDCEKYKVYCEKCPQVKVYPKSLLFDRSSRVFEFKRRAYTEFNTLTLLGPETNLIKFRESALVKDKPMVRASWGVDLDLYRFEIDDSLYDKYHIPRNKIIILTVANYSNPRKGVKQFFFEVARRLENSDYHFVNVGYDGELKKNEIPNNMTTIPYVDNQVELSHLYSMSDLYLLASTTDTMPISCLIAFACETPVCCFYTSGLKYLAHRGNPAIAYCDEISVDALEEMVKNTSKKKIENMEACRKLAKEEYSIDSFNKKVFEVIRD